MHKGGHHQYESIFIWRRQEIQGKNISSGWVHKRRGKVVIIFLQYGQRLISLHLLSIQLVPFLVYFVSRRWISLRDLVSKLVDSFHSLSIHIKLLLKTFESVLDDFAAFQIKRFINFEISGKMRLLNQRK